MQFAQMTAFACSLMLLVSCAGGSKQEPAPEQASFEGLSDRLNRNYGYEVDTKGNWVPRTDKRSQYEGQADSTYFNGQVGKKSFQTQNLDKGSWMGGKEAPHPTHQLSGSKSSVDTFSRYSKQQASLNRSLQTPARIEGNHLPGQQAYESGGKRMANASDAETDLRRRVFQQPDIIDYRQQRDLSIQQSKQLLGNDE